MTLATTSSIWRSTGGDQTRTATAGSMVMTAPFYISNLAATTNVTVRDPSTDGVNGTPRTSTETKPKNYGVLYIIKT